MQWGIQQLFVLELVEVINSYTNLDMKVSSVSIGVNLNRYT